MEKQFNEALVYLNESISIFIDIEDNFNKCTALMNRGNIYRELSQWNKSIEDYEQSLSISRLLKDRHREGQILGNIGNTYLSQKSWEEAIKKYNNALDIFKEIGDTEGERKILKNLGIAYANNGNINLAEECCIKYLKTNKGDSKEQEFIECLLMDLKKLK